MLGNLDVGSKLSNKNHDNVTSFTGVRAMISQAHIWFSNQNDCKISEKGSTDDMKIFPKKVDWNAIQRFVRVCIKN